MKNIAGKNILVTGGTGFVGAHLVEELIKEKANVFSTIQSINPNSYFFTQKLNKETILTSINVQKFEEIFKFVTKYNINYIFHLAAQALVEPAYYNPKETLYTNILGTINILECVRLYPKIKGLFLASSDKAYGKLNKDKYLETDPLQGDHPYEVSKSTADLITQAYFKTYNLPVVIARFGNIYGEGDLNFSRIVPGIIKSIVKNELLEIRSDGKHVRDYLCVKDVVSGYFFLFENLDKIKGEAFNFGSKEKLSVIELIELIEKRLKRKINYKILNIAKNEIPYQNLDDSKMKQLGWRTKYNLEISLKKILLWYRKSLLR